MKKNKVNQLIEYLSPILILSYFYIHNILLVLIGISFSLYLINIKFINKFFRSINKSIIFSKLAKELNKNDNETKSNSINLRTKKEDKKLTLVETIEELGFIPSINETDDSNAA